MSRAAAFERSGYTTMNTVLYCEHWERTVAFYEEVLALPRGFANEWFVEFLVASDARLSVANAARATVSSAHGAGITITLEVDDIDACRAALAGRGAAPPAVGPRPFGARGFVLRDPEGNRIEFWESAKE